MQNATLVKDRDRAVLWATCPCGRSILLSRTSQSLLHSGGAGRRDSPNFLHL